MLKTVYFDIMVLAGIGIDRHKKRRDNFKNYVMLIIQTWAIDGLVKIIGPVFFTNVRLFKY